MATSFFIIYVMATSYFYIYVMATSFFFIFVMATGFSFIAPRNDSGGVLVFEWKLVTMEQE